MLTGCKDSDETDINDAAIQAAILDEFTNITEVPRESGQSKAISTYLRSWASDRGFEVKRDKAYNIIINRPASEGYENAPMTILQSNMDTISIASEGVVYDPLNDPIKMINDGKSLYADGTSLGADSGIGMATAMYVLEHAEFHGPLRVIFTTNGETSMSGAKGLDDKYLEGSFLINLNGETPGTIIVGSPCTYTFTMEKPLTWAKPENALSYDISIRGLSGGNFLSDIDKEKANAVKVLGETLATIQGEGILFELAAFNGGSSKDEIPTDASAHILINENDLKKFEKIMNRSVDAFAAAYSDTEKNYTFTYQEAAMPEKVVTLEDESSIVSFIYGILDGVQTMSPFSNGNIESATNLGIASTSTGRFLAEIYAISSSKESEMNINDAHISISNMCDLQNSFEKTIPGWTIDKDDVLIQSLSDIFLNLDGEKPAIETLEAPYECGWFSQKNPEIKIASIGPQIHNADTSAESLVIDTVALPARVILTFLEQTK